MLIFNSKDEFYPQVQDLHRLCRPHILIIVEPRISGDHALDVINHLGFQFSYHIDPIGFSGDI